MAKLPGDPEQARREQANADAIRRGNQALRDAEFLAQYRATTPEAPYPALPATPLDHPVAPEPQR